MKTNLLLPFFVLISVLSNSQTIYFSQGFENGGSSPIGWTQEYATTGHANWNFISGGGPIAGSSDKLPAAAHSGNYNARFYKQSFTAYETYLVTPTFSLEFAQKALLRFWYAQYADQLPGGEPDNTKLSLYYRTPEYGNVWVKLRDYNAPTEGWVIDSVYMPDSIRFSQVQLGFKGKITIVGFGTCIDDVSIIETDTVTKYLEKVYASQPTTDLVPTGSNDNPILRLRFPVKGNDGNLYLDSLVVTALEQIQQVVPANGVKLYATNSDYFTPDHLLGSSTFLNGKAIFSNLHYDLPYGNTYVWVTCNVPDDPNHIFKGYKLDAKIIPNSIKVNANYFPTAELNPNGSRTINESLFFDNFETNKDWTFTGEFEWAKPLGLGGFHQNSDPSYAHSGQKIIGTDLIGHGDHYGDYEANLPADGYQAKTTEFNCYYYKDISLQFYRWLNVNFSDTATIGLSLDDGATWQKIWINPALINENQWTFQKVLLTSLADRKESVRVRFALGPTGSYQFLSGWNIDDVALVGTFVATDASLTKIVAPLPGCGHNGAEVVSVKIKNTGYNAIATPFTVSYSSNNGITWVSETVSTPIARDQEITYNFTQLINISALGTHHIIAKVALTGDEDSRNNSSQKSILVLPTYSLPYVQNFETNDGYWQKGGKNNTWAHGTPTKTFINHAASGTKCWVTNLTGNYPNGDSATLTSPCFDFSQVSKGVFECKLLAMGKKDKDGLALYYSIDQGEHWEFVPSEGSYNWNWYNRNSIEALETAGWDSVGTNWKRVRQLLPEDLSGKSSVKFMLVFKSNSDDKVNEGFAFDDFKVYEAPVDAGVVAFKQPVDSCYLSAQQAISVYIKNFGVRDIQSYDQLFTKVKMNGSITLIDTFTVNEPLEVGDSALFTFTPTLNMFDKGDYQLVANTFVQGDTAFYYPGVYNDTLIETISVLGEPRFSLGPDIGTLAPDTVLLDAGAGFTYLWHDNSTAQTFDVPAFSEDEQEYHVKITNANNCEAFDTINIIKSVTDFGIVSVAGIADACEGSSSPTIEVGIKSYGALTIAQGEIVKVAWQINNGLVNVEEFALEEDFETNDTIYYNFENQPELNEAGIYDLHFFSVVRADLDYSNDTLAQSVEIYPLPLVDIGPDTIYTLQADTLLFDAGVGFASYFWQNNATTQSFDVISKFNGTYTIKVGDSHSCGFAYDTVRVVADNWVLDSVISPETSCSLSSAEQVSVHIINQGPNIYPAGTEMNTVLTFNGTAYPQIMTLTEPLAANSGVDMTFAPVFNMSAPGNYNIQVSLNPLLDVNFSDNSIDDEINVWGIKKVDLGPDTLYTLNADTVLLDAGQGFETYLWKDLSTASSYAVSALPSDRYWVSVTDYHGCPSSVDTVTIVTKDLAVDELYSPESNCDIAGIQTIKFLLRNSGRDVISFGEELTFKYQIDNGVVHSIAYTVPYDMDPGQTKIVTFNQTFDFESDHMYDFKLYVDWDKDYFNENDTVSGHIHQYPKPDINFGPDIITHKADTVVLHSPINMTNYSWSDGSRKDSLKITYPGTATYWGRAGNAYGCFKSDTITIFTYDVQLELTQGSQNRCDIAAGIPVTAKISINGIDSLIAGQQLQVSYHLGSVNANELVTLNTKLNAANPYLYTFNQTYAITDTGNYTISAAISLVNEAKTDNNTFNKDFRVGAYPVSLGSDIKTYDDEFTLDAGEGFVTYLWSTGDREHELEVDSSAVYAVTVTDVNGCFASDSMKIFFAKPNYKVAEILGLNDSCIRSQLTPISFILANHGNDTVYADSSIVVSYQVNNKPKISESFKFTSDFTPNDSIEVVFATKADFASQSEYNIHVAATFGLIQPANDTVIFTWGLPQPDLGDDIETTNDVVSLTPGDGFASYLWNTNETSPSIVVKASGQYWVEVTNNQGCQNSDTILVNLIPANLAVTNFNKPLSTCGYINGEKVGVDITNNGQKVIKKGSVIAIEYRVASVNPVVETIELLKDMNHADKLSYDFVQPLTVPGLGMQTVTINQPITFYLKVDDVPYDTAQYVIAANPLPRFDFGSDTIKVEEYPYNLTAPIENVDYTWSTGQDSRSVVVTKDGEFRLTVINEYYCQFSDTVYVELGNSVPELTEVAFTVYPNPVTNKIHVAWTATGKTVELMVTAANGKMIYRDKTDKNSVWVDVSAWPQGVYFVKVTDGNLQGVVKLVKQ